MLSTRLIEVCDLDEGCMASDSVTSFGVETSSLRFCRRRRAPEAVAMLASLLPGLTEPNDSRGTSQHNMQDLIAVTKPDF
jgi:hypothetical protein